MTFTVTIPADAPAAQLSEFSLQIFTSRTNSFAISNQKQSFFVVMFVQPIVWNMFTASLLLIRFDNNGIKCSV